MPNVKIAPSILSADFARFGEQVAAACAAGADYIHVDVMDGCFVPEITFGAALVRALKRGGYATVPLDVHLMVAEPERQIPLFADALRVESATGADIITVHAEACPHLHRAIGRIKALGVRAGVALNPGTPIQSVIEVLPDLDRLLLMTVDPGYGGQPFIAGMERKIARARRRLDDAGLAVELAVDGGINATTAPLAVRAGARVLVAGSAVFGHADGIAPSMAALRAAIEGA